MLESLLKRLAQDWSAFSAKAGDFLAEGSRVVSFGVYAGTHRVTGKSMTADFAHLWSIRDGRLGSFLMYTDTAKILEAVRV